MKMLLNIRKSIEPVLLNLVNCCIYNSDFPKNIKINKIIPIAKDTDHLSPSHYRSINIFSPISKIIEKCWAIQIDKYLVDNNYLPDNHQGGIKGQGTATSTINIQAKINQIINSNKIAAVIGLDQSGCYQIIAHSILLKKRLQSSSYQTIKKLSF